MISLFQAPCGINKRSSLHYVSCSPRLTRFIQVCNVVVFTVVWNMQLDDTSVLVSRNDA